MLLRVPKRYHTIALSPRPGGGREFTQPRTNFSSVTIVFHIYLLNPATKVAASLTCRWSLMLLGSLLSMSNPAIGFTDMKLGRQLASKGVGGRTGRLARLPPLSNRVCQRRRTKSKHPSRVPFPPPPPLPPLSTAPLFPRPRCWLSSPRLLPTRLTSPLTCFRSALLVKY